MDLDFIPEDLRQFDQFVCWDLKDGRKLPINPHDGSMARANDPSTWGSYDLCCDRVVRGLNRGIGFEFSDTDPFCGIDFDHCLDQDGRIVDQNVRAFVSILWRSKTYCEISQSGSGLHVIVKNLVSDDVLRSNKGGRKFGNFCEVYQSARYFALTGDAFHAFSKVPRIKHLENRLWAKCLKLLDSNNFNGFQSLLQTKSNSDPVAELVEKNSRFADAYFGNAGQWGGDQSRRDIYVMSQLLKIYQDRDLTISAFKSSPCGSFLQRKVGHVQDYLDRTFNCAERNLNAPNSFSSSETSNSSSVSRKKNESTISIDSNYSCTDQENSCKLLEKSRKSVVFSCKNDQFYRWRYPSELNCWSEVDPVCLYDFCQLISKDLFDQAQSCRDQDLKKRLYSGSKMMLMNAACDRAIQRLKSFPELFVDLDSLDGEDLIVPCRNKYFHLDSGEVEDPSSKYLFTRCFDVVFAPEVVSDDWNSFLDEVLPDVDVRREVQKFFGYCLTGDISQERFMYIYGHGGNGKGTFLSAIQSVLGKFSTTFSMDLLNQTKFKDGESPSPMLMNLRSVRLAVSDEVNASGSINVAMLKSLTGGDRIIGRALRKDPVEFVPKFKLVMVGNEKLVFGSSHDDGLRRRLIYVPFDQVISRVDLGLKRRLQSDRNRSAILNWLIEGYQLLMSEGFMETESMVDGKNEMMSIDDLVSNFIAEYCVFDESKTIKVSQFVSQFQSTVESSMTRGSIVRAVLADRRIKLIRPGNIQTFKGVGWIATT